MGKLRGWGTAVIAGATMGIGMNAHGFLGIGDAASWKEEVLLQDGRRILVQRSQTRGGRHEIGQEVPLAQHTIAFERPGTQETIVWKTEYGNDPGKTSLQLLAIEIVEGVPYVVTTPTGCIAYNKWKRPNPPYVVLKYAEGKWQPIALGEFPTAIKEANVVIGTQVFERRLIGHSGVIAAQEVSRMNAEAKNPEVQYLRHFVREPIKVPQTVECPEMVYDGKGGWLGLDWFTLQPNLDACLKLCERKGIDSEHCPCNSIFGRK